MMMRVNRFPVVHPMWESVLDFDADLDRVMREFGWPMLTSRATRGPLMNLVESEKESILEMELPGVSKEDLRISLEKDVLTITGERKAQGIPEDAKWIRSESVSGKFQRSISLPHPVDPKAIAAELKNGILRVVLPKGEEMRPREIAIR
ncbi:MAG: Hsp20/alpha crystallin family protein [Bacteroidetes bacterium]|nr:Hsp20/alpha crystallin family protein [Bacteroidota bacterium]